MVTKLIVTLVVFFFITLNSYAFDCDRRVQLEQNIQISKKRLLELEAKVEQDIGTEFFKDVKTFVNWRMLRIGMSMDDVKEILGDPDVITDYLDRWTYNKQGKLWFDSNGLDSWEESVEMAEKMQRLSWDGPSRNYANWHKLEFNMSPEEVIAILGQPKRIKVSELYMTFYYQKQNEFDAPTVSFDENRMSNWLLPKF